MLAQDVPANQISDRIGQWAQLAAPGADHARVAHLLGVPVTGDSGQPAKLALANFPSAQALALEAGLQAAPGTPARLELAVAAPAPLMPEPKPVEQMPVELMTVEVGAPAPVQYASLDQPSLNFASDTPRFTSVPVVQTFAVLPPRLQPAPAKKPRAVGNFVPHGADAARPGKSRALTAPKPLKPVFGGSYWLQLGSYVNPAVAKDGWRKFTSRTPALKPYKVTTTTATVKGTPVWRVAATGFASYGDAANMCRTVKRRGGACLVVTAPKGLGGGGGVTARR